MADLFHFIFTFLGINVSLLVMSSYLRTESSVSEIRKTSKKRRKLSIIVGAAISLLCLILFILGVLFWRCYSGDKNTRERGVD